MSAKVTLNLDELVEAPIEWDFIVDLDGQEYMTIAEARDGLASLKADQSLMGDEATRLIQSAFVDPAPNVAAWNFHRRYAFAVAYLQYRRQRKDAAISKAVNASIFKQMNAE